MYTFQVETATKDLSDGFGKMLTAQSWSASYSNVTFNVTPEPVGFAVAASSLLLLTRRHRR